MACLSYDVNGVIKAKGDTLWKFTEVKNPKLTTWIVHHRAGGIRGHCS